MEKRGDLFFSENFKYPRSLKNPWSLRIHREKASKRWNSPLLPDSARPSAVFYARNSGVSLSNGATPAPLAFCSRRSQVLDSPHERFHCLATCRFPDRSRHSHHTNVHPMSCQRDSQSSKSSYLSSMSLQVR